nr:hypothetical protein [Tanacetum cinerariifolium]
MRTNPLPRLGEGIYTPSWTGHVVFLGVQHSLGPFLGPISILRAFTLFYGMTDTLRVSYISPSVPGQSFDELPFEEGILDFLWFLGHSAQIKTLTNNTQQYGTILPIELTTEDIRNTKAYREYYACATGEAVPKPKASARRKRGGSDSSTTLPTAVASPRPITTHGGSSTDEGTGSKPRVPDVPFDDLEEEISWNSSDDAEETENDEEKTREEEEERFDPILRTPEDSEDDGNGEEDKGLRIIFRFEERVKSLEVNFSEFMQTNQFAKAVSNMLGIVHQYMTHQMMEAVREAVQIQTDRLQDSFQRENDEFLRIKSKLNQ